MKTRSAPTNTPTLLPPSPVISERAHFVILCKYKVEAISTLKFCGAVTKYYEPRPSMRISGDLWQFLKLTKVEGVAIR